MVGSQYHFVVSLSQFRIPNSAFRIFSTVPCAFKIYFVSNCQSFLSSPDGRYFCSIELKSNQKSPLPHRSEGQNHRQPFPLFSMRDKLPVTTLTPPTAIGDFEISTLCFSGALSRTSLFKTALHQILPLDRAFTKLSQSSFTQAVSTLYQLSFRQSLVAGQSILVGILVVSLLLLTFIFSRVSGIYRTVGDTGPYDS